MVLFLLICTMATAPLTLTLLGQTNEVGSVTDIKVVGTTAYAAAGEMGLVIFDISKPNMPRVQGKFDTGYAFCIDISGTVAYIGDKNKGLFLVDVSTPSTPVHLGTFNITSGEVAQVCVSGGTAYIANTINGVLAVDISNPSIPVLQGAVNTPDHALTMHVLGTTVYIADKNTMVIADFSTPSAPTSIVSVDDPSCRAVSGVFVSGTTAYIGCAFYGLKIYDISTPAAPVLVGASFESSYDLKLIGTTIYAAASRNGLAIIDVSTLSAPVHLGSFSTHSDAKTVQIVGSTVYIACDFGGFRIVDASNSTAPKEVGTYNPSGGEARDVYVSGTYAYLLERRDGLQVIDISNPAAPVVVGTFGNIGTGRGVYVEGNNLYVADNANGLVTFDVTIPTSPSLQSTFWVLSAASGVHVIGTIAYVTDSNTGLHAVNVTEPIFPKSLGSIATSGVASDVYVLGTIAYVAAGATGLLVIDVSNVSSLTILGSADTPGNAQKVFVSGKTAYIADGDEGLQIVNVATPSSPTVLGQYKLATGPIVDVHVCACSPTLAYTVAATGLYVIDVSNPLMPVLVNSLKTAGAAEGLFVTSDAAYVGDVGLMVVGAIPVTPAPRVSGKGSTMLQVKGSPVIDSIAIQENGGAAELQLFGGTVFRCFGCTIKVEVRWPGGRILSSTPQGAQLASCGGVCMVIATDTTATTNTEGLAAIAQKNPSAVQGGFGATDLEVTQALNGSDTLVLTIKDKTFRAYAPLSEMLKVFVAAELFDEGTWQKLCSNPEKTSSEIICSCANGMSLPMAGVGAGCVANYKLQSQTPDFPNKEEIETISLVGTTAVLGVSAIIPVSPTAGGSMMRVALLTQGMYCPSDGPTKLDRLVNPLQLKLGDDPDQEEVNGAVLGGIILQALCLAIGLLCTFIVYLKAKEEARDFNDINVAKVRKMERDGLKLTYLGARAHFGWLLIPAAFLYGGVAMSCSAALLYSTAGYKVLGGANLIFLGLGLPVYAFWVAHTAEGHTSVEKVTVEQSWMRWFFWGKKRWTVHDGFLDESWQELHRLVYDGYARHAKEFLFKELIFTAALGMLEAYEPETYNQCRVKGIIVCCLLLLFLLVLVISRPYIAPYENAFETVIVTVELVMACFIVVAIGMNHPTDHWSALWAGNLSIVSMNLILLKFVIDLVIFLYDERKVWIYKGLKGSFVAHLLCCGNKLLHDDARWAAGSANADTTDQSINHAEENLAPPSFVNTAINMDDFSPITVPNPAHESCDNMYEAPDVDAYIGYEPPSPPRFGISWRGLPVSAPAPATTATVKVCPLTSTKSVR
eukprot:TRINITY_DN17461_c0_g1_i1.p1 TRINITY_DN17461_c0_g1~~TRINITY_DN17461_c0_g1_i1.p1  ORF type:complete len:1308 (+),score=167.87 TRINITY_DN17461_c0_g1_i1:42-3965(+)